MPPYIPHLNGVCTKEAFENLMNDVEELFKKHSQGCLALYIKRRPKFEAALGRILKAHQDFKQDGVNVWGPKTLRW